MLEHFWYRIRPAHLVLFPLSLLFGAVVAVRRWLYRAGGLHCTRMRVPVIVVGNITVGGSGKTPSVLWLVDCLQEHGYRPGIVLRGYGGSEQSSRGAARQRSCACGRRIGAPGEARWRAGFRRPRSGTGRAGPPLRPPRPRCAGQRRRTPALWSGARRRDRSSRWPAPLRQWLAASRRAAARAGVPLGLGGRGAGPWRQ